MSWENYFVVDPCYECVVYVFDSLNLAFCMWNWRSCVKLAEKSIRTKCNLLEMCFTSLTLDLDC